MFRQKTTIIVGAGASCELDLPSGDGLKTQILYLLRPARSANIYGFEDELIQQAIQQIAEENPQSYYEERGRWQAAGSRICRGLPLAASIDNFLHSHQEDDYVVRLGKLAIGICILKAERGSRLFPQAPDIRQLASRMPMGEPTTQQPALQETWYPAFARLLMSGAQRGAIREVFGNVRFIIFNYDRCLEQYIWMALQDYFDVSEQEAAEVLDDVEFIHPYGSLGILPWQRDMPASLAFGATHGVDYWRVGDRLRTFTESSKNKTGIIDAVQEAETLLLLGFGYLDQNLQLMRPHERRATRAISTAYDVSPTDQKVMQEAMMTLGHQTFANSFIETGKCADLFKNYRMMLSLS